MELRQLEYFVAVAEEANFTRAAARVHISQSGVSAQVSRLERELGAPLIDRSGRTATLTAAGAAVVDLARQALASAEAVRQTVQEINGLLRGRLSLGMVTGCTITPLFDAVSAFATAHPGNRWRLFAVAACGSAVRGQHEADVYVGRLRARRAQTPIPTYGGRRGRAAANGRPPTSTKGCQPRVYRPQHGLRCGSRFEDPSRC